jgi:hypothetical protein
LNKFNPSGFSQVIPYSLAGESGDSVNDVAETLFATEAIESNRDTSNCGAIAVTKIEFQKAIYSASADARCFLRVPLCEPWPRVDFLNSSI